MGKKEFEEDFLLQEELSDEEDYEEYARSRDAHRGYAAQRRQRALEDENTVRRQSDAYERQQRDRIRRDEEEREYHRTRKYRRRKRRRRHPVRRFVLTVLILVIVLVLGFAVYLRSRLKTVDSIELEEQLQSSICDQVREDTAMKEYQNIALFGVDSREQDLLSGNNRSDTIMICSINERTKEVKLVSVYRDTLLDVGGGEYRKCNAAYALGGPQQAIAMLNMNLDLNITDFVTVGFEGLADTIDALGGIDLEVTEEEVKYINSYMKDMHNELGTQYDELTGSGMQHLSGIQATAYCRIRYTSGDDFKRTQRQRTVLSLTLQKAKKANLLQLISVANSVSGEMATSLKTSELFKMLLLARSFDLSDSTGVPLEEYRTYATVNGESCVIPYSLSSNVTALHETLFGETGYTPCTYLQQRSDYIMSLVQ